MSRFGSSLRRVLPVALLLLVFLPLPAPAADGEPGNEANGGNGEDDAPKSIAELTENADRHDGLFTVYRDRDSGSVHIALRPEQLGREYIYTAVIVDGPVDTAHYRGRYRENRVISLRRHYDRIELRAENTAFHFDPDSPLSRAASANMPPAVLAVEEIVTEDPDTGELLIRGDRLLLDENLVQVRPTPDPDRGPREGFRLGDLDRDRSRLDAVRSYPRNTDFVIEYVYRNPAPLVRGGPHVTDPRHVSVLVQHSLLEMPDNDYRPRLADHRLGHFAERVTDLTSASITPYRDVIRRWDLRKRDPEAELSEPVEPIVWWIENTTPYEFRDTIRDAVLGWNSAFEKIGYRNAIEVRVQPDDADWDAGDLRYNVLRWTSLPNPPFGGYGPSFSNPRTGQIISSSVMLEYSSVVRSLQQERLRGMLEGGFDDVHVHSAHCALGLHMQASQAFGRFAVSALDLGTEAEEALVHEFLTMLVLHEIGHTLGFQHNFAASRMLELDEMYDPEVAGRGPLTGSVMDYADVHLAPPGREHTRFFQVQPGPYDDWVVEYAYSDGLEDARAERERLAAIAARSTEPQLAFGNDADIMGSPGQATDPRVLPFDMSADPIGYALDRIELVHRLLERAADADTAERMSAHELIDAYFMALLQLRRSAGVIARHIGGVESNQTVPGQADAAEPFVPVAADEQRRAMAALAQHLFAPEAFVADGALYARLQRQRRLFDARGTTQDPKLHAHVLGVQRNVLDHLMHPVVLRRVTDSRLYGNDYGLGELMQELTDAVFAADLRGDVNTFRQNLQMEYVTRLGSMVSGPNGADWDHVSRAMALHRIRELQRALRSARRGNAETAAHRARLLFKIEKALEANGRS